MSKAKMGANVLYCGHQGWFIADIFEIEGVNVVKANGKITPGNLTRNRFDEITHHVSDFPVAGCWDPNRGFLVVPSKQVTDLSALTPAARKKFFS